MSPEILNEQGHDTNSDWWSLGILLYELASGSPPFKSKNMNKMSEEIQFEELPIKSYFSKNFASLLTGLTHKNPIKRLGHKDRGGVQSIKKHKFFANIDWNKVMKMEYPSPVLPFGINSESNSDDTFKLLRKNFDKKIINSEV